MKKTKKKWLLFSAVCTAAILAAGCGSASGGKDIVYVGHNQASDHPTNIALLAFEEFIESRLGDKYDVEVYPSELLGSQTDSPVSSRCRPLCAAPVWTTLR